MRIDRLFETVLTNEADKLVLRIGFSAAIEKGGELRDIDTPILSSELYELLIQDIFPWIEGNGVSDVSIRGEVHLNYHYNKNVFQAIIGQYAAVFALKGI